MNLFKKAAVSLAAVSMLAALVVASAQTRATSDVAGESELEGSTAWIVAIVALAAIIGGIVLASDNNSDTPTSP